jgi:hypothetical protein
MPSASPCDKAILEAAVWRNTEVEKQGVADYPARIEIIILKGEFAGEGGEGDRKLSNSC